MEERGWPACYHAGQPFLLDVAIMYVLGVAGYSGSGKTTLLEKVIP
jgi:Ni2+-binding GTPase involved in maturation of urease and hydrogenase